MENKAAVISGTWDEPFSMTYTRDLGKFVAATLDMLTWDKEFRVHSETNDMESGCERS